MRYHGWKAIADGGLQLLSVFAAALALTACASTTLQGYAGPVLPDGETALVSVQRTSGDRMAATLRITAVEALRQEPTSVTATSIRVLPGDTCLGVRARTSTLHTFSPELCFEAYAGTRYEIIAQVQGSSAPPQLESETGGVTMRNTQNGPFFVTRVLIIDSATREIVAAATP